MQDDKTPSELLRYYVLGALTEAEQARLEEECFSDPARQQELWAVFDEMAEQFLQGELAPTEAQKFAARLQASPLLRERVANLHALLHTVAARTPPPTPPAQATRSSRWMNWFAWPAWQAGLAATALLLALGVAWWSRNPASPVQEIAQAQPSGAPTSNSGSPAPTARASETPKPRAEPHGRPPAASHPASAQVATFFLLQEITRDQRAATPLTITKSVELLELQLEVRPPLYPDYQVIVQTAAGQTLATAQNLRPHRRDRMEFLTVRFPVAKLPEEALSVRISGLAPGQEPKLLGAHSLQVVKK